MFFCIILLILIFLSFCFYEIINQKSIDLLFKQFISLLVFISLIYITSNIGINSTIEDHEIWNGQIIDKRSDKVSCKHSYACNCRSVCSTNSKGKVSCRTKCDTCYEHRFDIDWLLITNVKNNIKINRVDRQGLEEPQRYNIAKIGDPIAEVNRYKNYLLGSKYSLFHKETISKEANLNIPEYPDKIYNYHYLDRVIDPDKVLSMENYYKYNKQISEILKLLGNSKQCNIIIYFQKENNHNNENIEKILNFWNGGKKNDIIIFLGINNENTIKKVYVNTLTDKEIFKVKLRDNLLDENIINIDNVINKIKNDVFKYYKRKSMKDFEYLLNEIELPFIYFVFMLILTLLGIFFNIILYKIED